MMKFVRDNYEKCFEKRRAVGGRNLKSGEGTDRRVEESDELQDAVVLEARPAELSLPHAGPSALLLPGREHNR